MKEVFKISVLAAVFMLLSACSAPTTSTISLALVDISPYNIVYLSNEQGDMTYEFELSSAQKTKLDEILQPTKWTAALLEELPEYGLGLSLCAKSDEYFMYVSPWTEDKSIIKLTPINEIGDGSDSLFYFAPADAGTKVVNFMATLD